MTRICKIKGFHNFIGGKDNNDIFEEGIIYDVQKLMGEIILTQIGKHSEFDMNGDELSKQHLEEIILKGNYLHTNREIKFKKHQ